ncbi:MAG TPA: nicotinate phosphoribosyltransferase [Marmoricola sp.]
MTLPAAPGVLGLCTDLYELRMAASYLRRGMTAPATFSLFARRLPAQRGFLVVAGVEACLDALEGYCFGADELAYLREVVGLPEGEVEALGGLRFGGDVLAVPEGRCIGADTPLMQVTAPLPQAQLVETLVLNQVTFATAVASKAARCRLAAGPAELVDFGARRTHGLEAATAVARACAAVGFAGTSYVEAARRLGLRPVGTMAHSYVQAFPDQLAAFRAFGTDFPEHPVFLVDTYDTEEGVLDAIKVARELGLAPERVGVRLDSGDLGDEARRARRMLDYAGMGAATVMASGGLDELAVAGLVAAGAPIDCYGVGTKIGTSWDAPSLDSAYKLVAYDGRPVLKLSPGKATHPAAQQAWRGGPGEADLLALRAEPRPDDRQPLLVPVMAAGHRLAGPEPVSAARTRFEDDLAWLPPEARRLRDPEHSSAVPSAALVGLAGQLAREWRPGWDRGRAAASAGRGQAPATTPGGFDVVPRP